MSKLFKSALATSIATAGIVAVLPVNVSADAAKFTDVNESHDYYADVYTLVERGVISGYADHTYRPNAELTRGQAAKILAIALGLEVTPGTTSSFKDVSVKNQYGPYIEALVKKGIINGYSDGTFKPQNTLTRAQMSKILVKGFELSAEGGALPFTDVTSKSGYFEDIQTLYKLGITKGNTATTYSPNAPVKRGQMASFVMRSERVTEVPAEEVTEELVIDSIVKVDGGQLILSKGTYEIAENLRGLLSEQNNDALKDASIEVTVLGDQLVNIASLTIKAQGTSEAPVILNGALPAEPVASLVPIATNIVTSFNGILTVESNYIQISNMKMTNELILSEMVKGITITDPVKHLRILSGVEAKIKGSTDIEKITVSSENPIDLQVEGTIFELTFTGEKAALKLGTGAIVKNILALKNVSMEKFILNYQSIKSNIEKVNYEVIKPDVPADVNPPITNPDQPSNPTDDVTEVPSVPVPIVKTLTGTIQTTSAAAVLIDGKSYGIDDVKIAELLHSRNTALEGAVITFVTRDGKIVEVKSLMINSAGAIFGGNTVITGSVIVNADGVTMNKLIVQTDLTLTQAVVNSFTANNVIVNGETIVEEQKTAVAASHRIAALNFAPYLAASAETTVTITFNDSTVATFVIKKNNVKMNADGTSTINSISVLSNGVELKAGNVLPQIIVSGNATNVVLNATIQNIKIESTENIEITGDAAVKNLEINSTQDVTLNVKGIVENVNVANDGKISLGSETLVGNVKSSDDKNIEDIISNYIDVKENIMPENKVDLDPVNKPFAAGVQQLYDRFGYYQINSAFTKGKQVSYLFTKPGEVPTYTVGEKITGAVIDNGEPFMIKIDKIGNTPNIVIFLTETDGTILEYTVVESRNNATFNVMPVKAFIEGNQAIIKTSFSDAVPPAEALGYVLLFSQNGIIAESLDDLNDIDWEKIDGVNSIKLPLRNANYTDELKLVVKHYSTQNFMDFTDEFLSNLINGLYEKSAVVGINDIDLQSLAYSIILNEVTDEYASDFYAQKVLVLYELWKSDKYLIDDLKTLSLSLHNFNLELGEAELGLVPFRAEDITTGEGSYASPYVRDGKLIIPPSSEGIYNYLIHDQQGGLRIVTVTFTVDDQKKLQANYGVANLIDQNAVPFTVATTTLEDTVEIKLTFNAPVTTEDTLTIETASGNYSMTPNEDSTIFTLSDVKSHFRADEEFTVSFAGRQYSFVMREDYTLTSISQKF